MSTLEVTYTPMPRKKPDGTLKEVFLPYLKIYLSYKHNLNKIPIPCLLDSGADMNLFPAQWGETVGIKIKSVESEKISGIGMTEIYGYKHKVKLFVVGGKSFESEVYFCYSQQMPLLGRNGFFDKFKQITFFETVKKIILDY
ncbi:MAG: hypothetical protein A2802_02590 [Candidatus Woykebacteria bacterium RIFCSPHIGHO2_01_FULL_43_29]|uniref:Peptidase A2 domain-containing protein n=2 Tax=Candidatus Woykeibacteriota TaxID=1817899 RepID=A0A1G1WVJ7_9BACT|nr:MAG: hypothetical protein A2802_02590 [Candidatus Woykebacteria bacterium RIFCSPHIGHO2_01_FULL_43_29]OGY29746.1 MAG: hypothetical protein A3J50_00805 [Candidatus Woykebacteria bacterium RIFCSPHIGHO2_02_FULL_43_16b]OGY31776.1 MAG: hypothetical protein A3A61_02135 [Candidatus Woykebacteria bacterium RIFCSPLOWO2_01_FULL_43_14]